MNLHVTDRLSAYLDEDLSVPDFERVQAHLETCPSCQQEFVELRALRTLLRGLPEPVPSEGFADRLHWRLQREAGRPSRREMIWTVWGLTVQPLRLAAICAAVLLVLGLPLGGWMSGRFGARETTLDANAYLHDYLVFAAERPLSDEVATGFATADVVDSQIR